MDTLYKKKKFNLREHMLRFGILYLLLMLILVASILSDTFFTAENGINVLRQASTTVIMALGMGMVIITAGIDLSVGSLAAMSGMLVAGAIFVLEFLGAHGYSVYTGHRRRVRLINGIIIAKFNISAMIVTACYYERRRRGVASFTTTAPR